QVPLTPTERPSKYSGTGFALTADGRAECPLGLRRRHGLLPGQHSAKPRQLGRPAARWAGQPDWGGERPARRCTGRGLCHQVVVPGAARRLAEKQAARASLPPAPYQPIGRGRPPAAAQAPARFCLSTVKSSLPADKIPRLPSALSYSELSGLKPSFAGAILGVIPTLLLMKRRAFLQQNASVLTAPARAAAAPASQALPATDPPEKTFDQNLEGVRRTSLRDWWLGQQLTQTTSLSEKMTLFWHNHFVVEFGDINSAQYGYEYVRLLRQHALGNIKQLAKDVTITPAMLRYLNGNQSVAAAKVLTGWRDNATTVAGYFTASRHDTTIKQFSSAFGNATIAPNGAGEYQDLINLIFAQAETARFLVRAIYRWFVYYVIDSQVETDIIQPLATILINNSFEVKPVLQALFNSQHFFDAATVGCLIKSPLDFTIGVCRQLELAFPPASSAVAQYGMWEYLYGLANVQQQTLGDPPNVAGWVAYYQSPQYHEL
nr:hypothetical protein [Tanacetum cinerariifolium]